MKDSFSYWERDVFLSPYDLIVVGAGIVGLSSALFFKKGHPDARVLVLDKGFLPEGASTRNAGFACVGSISEHVADLNKESEAGIQQRLLTRYRGLKLLRETLGDRSISYEACGGYELFTTPESFEAAAEQIPRFNEWTRELLGEADVYHGETLNGYPVVYNRLEGALHPGRMMRRLVALVGRQGVEIKWNAPVQSTDSDGRLLLGNGMELEAGRLLIATNGFTSRLLPEIKVKPARGQVLVTNEQPDLLWRGTFHHDRGYVYFRHLGNRLLVGGARNIAESEEETDRFGINETIKDHLVSFIDQTLKLPAGWRVDFEWSGIMGFTDTKTPIVRQIDDRRIVAAGLSGMGVAIGMEIGRKAASLAIE